MVRRRQIPGQAGPRAWARPRRRRRNVPEDLNLKSAAPRTPPARKLRPSPQFRLDSAAAASRLVLPVLPSPGLATFKFSGLGASAPPQAKRPEARAADPGPGG